MTLSRKPKIILLFSLILILSAILLPGKGLFIALPIYLGLIGLIDKEVLFQLRKRWFWIWLMGGLVLLPLIAGDNKIIVMGVGYSTNTLTITLRVIIRSIFIIWGSALLRRHIPPLLLADKLHCWGFKRLAVFLPLSLYLAPVLIESGWKTYCLWRERGGMKKWRWRNFTILLSSLQIGWVKEAEDLAIALSLAEMRPENPMSNV